MLFLPPKQLLNCSYAGSFDTPTCVLQGLKLGVCCQCLTSQEKISDVTGMCLRRHFTSAQKRVCKTSAKASLLARALFLPSLLIVNSCFPFFRRMTTKIRKPYKEVDLINSLRNSKSSSSKHLDNI